MQVLGDKILVIPDETEKVTAAGIIIPNASPDRQKSRTGTIVNVSPTVTTAKVGEIAYFGPRAGKQVEINGVKHIVLNVGENDNEVFAIKSNNNG